MSDRKFVWRGILDPSHLQDGVVSASHHLADAAKVGDWSTVFGLLDDRDERVDINWWRPGGPAWFTVLHQAAWHGAAIDVVVKLIARGALRSVTDSRGRTPYGVYLRRHHGKPIAHEGNSIVRELLKPPPSPLPAEQVRALDRHLAAVINGRIRGVLYHGRDPQQVLRYPPVDILYEVPGQRIWFPVPGMYGGFDITLMDDFLDVKSWSRVFAGSGQEHLITIEGAILVADGFR